MFSVLLNRSDRLTDLIRCLNLLQGINNLNNPSCEKGTSTAIAATTNNSFLPY